MVTAKYEYFKPYPIGKQIESYFTLYKQSIFTQFWDQLWTCQKLVLTAFLPA